MEDSTIQGGAMMNAVRQVQGLFANVNKALGGTNPQSIKEEDEYTSKLSDKEILDFDSNWSKDYLSYYQDIEKLQDKSISYWLGKQKVDAIDSIEGRETVVNQLFQAVETFLPIATRSNPEPLVSADNSQEGQNLAGDVKNALAFQADKQKLRRKLARMTRHWMLYLTGVLEVEYDSEIDDIKTTVINPKRVIFDKEGCIDEAGLFCGEYLGIKCKASASKLMRMFPEHADFIKTLVNSKKGTKLEYKKWWYRGTDVFFTLPGKVLGKFRNPHWNYDGEVERPDDITGEMIKEEVIGTNHLDKPTAPYVFLSIFNIGLQPHDDTSLLIQNFPQQDQINKRYKQLDKNIDSQNNGLVVNGKMMTKEQAAEAAGAMRRGASIYVDGNVNEAIGRPIVPQLPSDVWNAVTKSEQNLQNIFGVSGSTPSGIKSEESARGKIMISQMDSSRIGGGITEFIEQVADTVYNLWVQMMFVHYDNEHYVGMLGEEEGGDTKTLSKSKFNKSLIVTVKEGSLIPKDPLTQRNEAIDLWSQSAIDPLNFYKKLDFPDPAEATKSLILWQMLQQGKISPEMYLPSFQMPQATAIGQSQGTGTQAVNDMTGTDVQAPTDTSGTQTGAEIQSKQLLNSVQI